MTSRVVPSPHPSGRATTRALYLGATAITTIGSAVGALEAASIATTADPSHGAFLTAVVIIELLVASTLTVPHVPAMASRWGPQRLYALGMAATGVIWTVAALAILVGLDPYPTLLVTVPLMGVTTGISTVMSPLFGRAYLSGDTMAGAYSRVTVVVGLSWAAGALVGGALLQHVEPGFGLLVRGVLVVPLVIVLATVSPRGVAPVATLRAGGSWSTLAANVRTPGPLRAVVALSCAVSIFVLPYLSLIVPIAAALRQVPLVSGAGLLMAGTALGEVLSPPLVSALQRRLPSLPAAAAAAILCGGCLALFALSSALLSQQLELAVWVMIGVAFGAARYTVKSLELDAAVNCAVAEAEAIAAVSFVKTAVAPIGLLLCASLMTLVSVEAMLLVAFAGITASAAAVWRSASRPSARVADGVAD